MSFLISTILTMWMAQAPNPLPEAFMSWPDVHGNHVVFTAEGDLWLGDLNTLDAKRITSDVGVERQAYFSPDGSEVSFIGNYDGTNAVYRMKLAGGAPEQLSYDNKPVSNLNGYSADGTKLLVSYPTNAGFASNLAWLNVQTHVESPLKFEMASFSSVGPKNDLALTRVSQTWQAWFGYRGGQANPIWYGDLGTMQFKKIYASKGSNEYPKVQNGRIYFCQDDDGLFYIKSVKPDGGDLRVHAGPYDVPLQHLRGDSGHLVYMKGPGLEALDLETGKVKPLLFHLESDEPKSRPFAVNAESWIQDMNLAPDAKRVLVEARGQIVSVPVKDGAARLILAKPGVRYRKPLLSPDKKHLAYLSDESGEEQIYVGDANGANSVQWTKGSGRAIPQFRWSPNGKFLVYSDSNFRLYVLDAASEQPINVQRFAFSIIPSFDISPDGNWVVAQQENPVSGFTSLVLYNVADKKLTPIDLGLLDATNPVFSTNGKWIGFLSASLLSPSNDPRLNQLNSNAKSAPFLLALRSDEKSPFLPKSDDTEEVKPAKDAKPEVAKESFRIDLEGLNTRLISIPAPAEKYSEIQIAGDRVLLPTDSEVKYYDLKAKKAGNLTAAKPFSVVGEWQSRTLQLSKDGTQVLVFGPKPHIVPVDGEDVKPEVGALNFGGLKVWITPKAEWPQIYQDAWRAIRDGFYADNLHGVNWAQIKAKYAPMVSLVRDRTDLTYLIKWLQSELSTGHMYTRNGDTRSLSQPQPAGFLGVDTVPEDGFQRITKIYRGDGFAAPSPLALPGMGVKEGDYLIEVAGMPTEQGSDWTFGLRGRAGKAVELKVNSKPSVDGARSILVEPLPSENPLRQIDWVETNRKYVLQKSGGKVGYIHLWAMGGPDFGDFIRQYFSQQDLDGIVVDIRYNGGGNLAGPLTEILARTVKMWGHIRNVGEYMGRDTDAYLGHLACLVNEHSYSEGEGFPFYFRAAKLGPIFGKRTWGGYVGSWPDWPLVDGSTIAVSHYGGWTPKEGWVIEGTGVVPDKEVENDPAAFAKGIDNQLDASIEYLMKEIKDKPVIRPNHPPFPIKTLKGRTPVKSG